jgi:hypothetical protein
MANVASFTTQKTDDGTRFSITPCHQPFPWWLVITGGILCCTLILSIVGIPMIIGAFVGHFLLKMRVGRLWQHSTFVASTAQLRLPPEFAAVWGTNATIPSNDIQGFYVRNNFGGVDLASCRRSTGFGDPFNRAVDAAGNAMEGTAAAITNSKLRHVGWRLDADAYGTQHTIALGIDEKTARRLLAEIVAAMSQDVSGSKSSSFNVLR